MIAIAQAVNHFNRFVCAWRSIGKTACHCADVERLRPHQTGDAPRLDLRDGVAIGQLVRHRGAHKTQHRFLNAQISLLQTDRVIFDIGSADRQIGGIAARVTPLCRTRHHNVITGYEALLTWGALHLCAAVVNDALSLRRDPGIFGRDRQFSMAIGDVVVARIGAGNHQG